MTQVTEAIYTQGVLKPLERLNIPDQQRVRLIVQPISGPTTADRDAAIQRLRSGIKRMDFQLGGCLPSRDELHDRD